MARLSPLELRTTLTSPQFAERLVEASDYTLDNDLETGFAIYKKDGNGAITYSDVLYPDREYMEAVEVAETAADDLPQKERLDITLRQQSGSVEPLDWLPTLHLGRLITGEATDNPADVAVLTRCHPLTTIGRRRVTSLKQLLLPTSRDIKGFGEQAAKNPDLIAGTSATHKELGGIALYLIRASSAESIQRAQALPEGHIITEQSIKELGLLSAKVVFDRHSGQVLSGLETIEKLYTA